MSVEAETLTTGAIMTGDHYEATTSGIKVEVEPFFIPEQSSADERRWVFGYKVTIANGGSQPVQLKSRHWKIVDALGRIQEVRGDGVIGEQPLIEPGDAFEYASGAPLPTSSGTMHGTYQMIGADGMWFDVEIPMFSLDAPGSRGSLN